jgi:hypothetical protein
MAQDENEWLDVLQSPELDTREGSAPSEWEQRFETQVNTFFDDAINRVPGFIDRNLKSLRRVLGRNLSPKTGIGDLFVGARNLVAGVSRTVGGPDFSTSTFTHEKLTRAFEREVVSAEELESLLRRLFTDFEESQWERVALASERSVGVESPEPRDLDVLRDRLVSLMESEIAHDPLLAQAIRAGVKIGIPATLGYVLFGRVTFLGGFGQEAASSLYHRQLNFYNRLLLKLGRFEMPGWLSAVGWAGGLVGTLALGGLMEYALNNIRDIKGYYIRQLNTARYNLLYGEDPDTPEGQGLMHVVRGLERQFDRLAEIDHEELLEVTDERSEELAAVEAPDSAEQTTPEEQDSVEASDAGEEEGAEESDAGLEETDEAQESDDNAGGEQGEEAVSESEEAGEGEEGGDSEESEEASEDEEASTGDEEHERAGQGA